MYNIVLFGNLYFTSLNWAETSKIFELIVKGQSITVTRWFKKFHSGCKNLNNQAKLGQFKSMDSDTMLQAIKANPASSTRRITGKLCISQSSVVHHFHNFSKNILNCQNVFQVIKIL